jgi:hypothetical protein
MYTVYDRMYGDFPAKNTVYTPYIPINVWFWPTLVILFLTSMLKQTFTVLLFLPSQECMGARAQLQLLCPTSCSSLFICNPLNMQTLTCKAQCPHSFAHSGIRITITSFVAKPCQRQLKRHTSLAHTPLMCLGTPSSWA